MSASREHELDELRLAVKRLFRTFGRLRGRDTHLAGAELSHAQFELLVELQGRGALSAGELAAAAGLTPGSVTQMLDSLAASGHVERARSDSDRRVVVSRLTPEGARQIEQKRGAWLERWRRTLADAPVDELRAATRVLERLDAMLDEEACRRAAKSAPGTVARARPDGPGKPAPEQARKPRFNGADGPENTPDPRRGPAIVDEASQVHAGTRACPANS